MVKILKPLKPRRGKYQIAQDQDIVLERGEIFLSWAGDNYSTSSDYKSVEGNSLYLGDGETPFSDLVPFITNEYASNVRVHKMNESQFKDHPLLTSEFSSAGNGAVRRLMESNICIRSYSDGMDEININHNKLNTSIDANGMDITFDDDVQDYHSYTYFTPTDIKSVWASGGSTHVTWERSDSLKQAVSNFSIVNLIYPIGSLYMSINNTDPSTLFDGTYWELLPGGYALKSTSNEVGGSTVAAGDTGSTTLTAAQSGLPAHNHTATGGAVTDKAAFNTNNSATFSITTSSSTHSHTYNRTYNAQSIKAGSNSTFPNYHTNADSPVTGDGAHTHTAVVSAHAHTVPAHGHGFTQPTISNATTQNATAGHTHTAGMPQNIPIYVWKRIS